MNVPQVSKLEREYPSYPGHLFQESLGDKDPLPIRKRTKISFACDTCSPYVLHRDFLLHIRYIILIYSERE